jgi:hypothetical protein
MRTTLTLDDDLAMMLKQEAEASGRPFRDVVNETIRRGLEDAPDTTPVELPEPVSMGPPLADLTKARALADQLDDEKRFGTLVDGR